MTIERHPFVKRARELAPVLAQRAQATEQNRAPLDASIDDLIESGLLSALTPKAYGGHELGVGVVADIVRTLSSACPSTGWVAAFYICAPWRVNIFSEKAQRELLADKPHLLMCGTATPLPEVERLDGGYRISGRTAWNSGSVHAEWFHFAGIVHDGDAHTPMWFLVPREQVEVLDTWYVSGMSGTGSNDVVVKDVFVPDYRTGPFALALAGRAPGQLVHDNPMYHLPFLSFAVAEVTPVVVGALRGLTDAFVERTRSRTGTLSRQDAAGQQAAQTRLGRALASADAAETLLSGLVQRLSAPGLGQAKRSERARTKLRASYITDLCRVAANDIVRGIGADGYRSASPLQRFHRDISILSSHAFLDIDTATETAARFELRLPIADRLV